MDLWHFLTNLTFYHFTAIYLSLDVSVRLFLIVVWFALEIELFTSGAGDVYYPSNDMDPYLQDKDVSYFLNIFVRISLLCCYLWYLSLLL